MRLTENKSEFIKKITIKLSDYENERKKRILKLIFQQLVLLFVTYIFFKGTLFFVENLTFLSVVCSIISFTCFICFFYNFSESNKNFKKFLKKKCKYAILKTFNLTTISGIEFPDDLLKKSNLFSEYTYQEPDDVINGNYNDIDYKIAETKLIAKGNKNSFEIFKGVIISFNSNKKIMAETLITSKGDNNTRNCTPNNKTILRIMFIWLTFVILSPAIIFSIMDPDKILYIFSRAIIYNLPLILIILAVIILMIYTDYKQRKKMKDVNLEDVSFDKKFNVYTKDQVEARYLLTPAFMDRLKTLETAFGTKGIKCSFFDDRIMFAIPTKKDLFELGSLYHSLKSQKLIEEFYNELESIQQMIDHFKLNENTGL